MFETTNQLRKPPFGFLKKGVQPPFSLDLLTGTCWEIPKFTSAKKAQRPAMELMTEGKSPAVFGLYSYDVPMMFPLYHIKSHPFLLGISVYPFFVLLQTNEIVDFPIQLAYGTPKTQPPKLIRALNFPTSPSFLRPMYALGVGAFTSWGSDSLETSGNHQGKLGKFRG